MLVGALTAFVARMLSRTLRADFSKLSKMANKVRGKDEAEEVGLTTQRPRTEADDVQWKKLQGDVFRTPPFPAVFACLFGTGFQIILMVFVFVSFNVLGFFNQTMRPLFIIQCLVILAFAGWGNGIVTSRTLKFFGGTDWIFAGTTASMVYPFYVIAIVILIDLFEKWGTENRSFHITSFAGESLIFIVWFISTAVISYHGAYTGFRLPAIQKPIKVNAVRRKLPQLPWYLHFKIVYPAFGAIVFASVFVEFYYILDSTWRSYHVYMLFGFLMTNLTLLIAVVALLSVLQTYFLLCNQYYEWWWRSFLLGFSGSLFMFVFSLYYMIVVLRMDYILAESVYLLYTLLSCTSFGLMCGFVSTFASFIFVKALYSNIKGE